MARTQQDITDAELSVLQVLWDAGPATIRQLADALYHDSSAAKYATVQKLLERLEDALCVTRDRSGAAHTFRAAVGRDDLIGRRLRDVAEKLCGGSLTPLLTHPGRPRPPRAPRLPERRGRLAGLAPHGKHRRECR